VTIQVWRDKRGKARVHVHTFWGKTEWRIYIEVKQVGIAPGTPFAFWQSLGAAVFVPRGTSRAALRDIRRRTAELYMLEHGGNYVLRGTV
jgi:hypothetical protein